MSEQQGQLPVGTKLIYQYPGTGGPPVPSPGGVPGWAPGVTGCPCSAQECRVLGSCVWELFPVDLQIKEIITGKSCSALLCVGLEVQVCGFQQGLAVDVSSVCWLSPFVLYERLGSS